MTNEELYRQYLSGNAEAFERLYLQMQGFIASVAKDAAQNFGCSDKEILDELCAEGALESWKTDYISASVSAWQDVSLFGGKSRCSGVAQGRNAAGQAGAAAAQGGVASSG